MSDSLRVGVGPLLLPVPALVWRRVVTATARRLAADVARLTDQQLRVRDTAVREMARSGRAVPPEAIASALGLARDAVVANLEELDRLLLYLHRDDDGAVEWAYPVTTARTPHRVSRAGQDPIGAA